jgi:serine/threonine protein kinase
MKHCDNCGGQMGDDHPFAICPECLFKRALRAHPDTTAGRLEKEAHDKSGDFIATSRLSARRDFFKKYDILERVAGGGQGDIWWVWDFELRRCAAMKRLSEKAVTSQPAVYRFLAEAQIASQLEHPGILPIFDVGLDPDGRPYYTSQLLPGTTLEDVWRQVHEPKPSEWNVNRALELMLRICDVMSHAHSRGVIHRDLKPSNILIGAFGDVRVIDWGSAHVLEAARKNFEETFVPLNWQTVETDRGRAMWAEPQSPLGTAQSGYPGTLLFVPPEIIAGKLHELGPATDVYSLGVMLYHLLAGRPAYAKPDGSLPEQKELRPLILQRPPEPVRSVNRHASRDLASICEKAMAHDKGGRYLTMEELAEDIRSALEIRPVRARKPTIFLKLQKWSQRNVAYVLTGCAVLIIISVVLSVARGFKSQRDFARQMTTVRNAELAARNGHWRDALKFWREAEVAGYDDPVYLELQQAEAWTILSESDKSRAILQKLSRRSDLGSQRGAVLLRLGEHELFDRPTAVQGVQHIHEALAAGLTAADQSFANGLLAESTPEALEQFRHALQFNPYHHGAHRHSLSLEFLLGRHQELANHLAVFKILYPDDPSPGFIAAAESAMAGNPAGTQTELAGLRDQVNSNVWEQANQACRAYAVAAKFYDVDALLCEHPPARTPLDKLRTDPFSAGAMLMPGDFTGMTNRPGSLRIPLLPCIQQGVLASGDGLRRLLQPYLGNPLVAVQEIEFGWHHHPEALIPTLAGMLLENQQPRTGPPLTTIMQMQARLYQLGADSPSMMPQIVRLARYLAARTEFELATRRQTNSLSAITNCLADIREAVASPETSVMEDHAYFQFALGLGDNDLALQLVNLLETRQLGDEATRRARIEVELALGAFGPALDKINQLLSDNPNNPWALAQRQIALSGIKTLMDSAKPNP